MERGKRKVRSADTASASARATRARVSPGPVRRFTNHPSVLQHVVKHLNNRNLAKVAGTSVAFRNAGAHTLRQRMKPPCVIRPIQGVKKLPVRRPRRVKKKGNENENDIEIARIDIKDGFIIKEIPDTFVAAYPTKKALLARLEAVLYRPKTMFPVAFYGSNDLPRAKAYMNRLRHAYQGIQLLCPDERLLSDIRDWYRAREHSFYGYAMRKRGAKSIVSFASTMSYWGLYIAMALAGVLNKTTLHGRGAADVRKVRWG